MYTRRRSTYERRSGGGRPQLISDVRTSAPTRVASGSVTSKAKASAVVRATSKAAPSRLHRSTVLKRQGVATPTTSKKNYRRRRRGLRTTALTVLAVLLFVGGLGVGGLQFLTNHKVQAQVAALTTTQAKTPSNSTNADPGVPAEQTSGSIADYHVGARLPRVLRIEKLGVEARVLQVSADANNQLKTPPNIFDAGWYNGSALPGDQGAVLLDGHVHGPTKPGVFVGLKKLQAGDKITLERGDGSIVHYHVVKTQSYAKDAVDMGAAFSSVTPGKPGLNLITCDGAYDDAGHYSNRLIVFAVQD